jgi:hypothetical protein
VPITYRKDHVPALVVKQGRQTRPEKWRQSQQGVQR